MGQNSDIHNIFESYSKKVLLKEQYTKEQISELEKKVNTITNPAEKKILLDEIAKGKAAPSTVAKPVDVPGPQPAGTPAPQKNFNNGIYKGAVAPKVQASTPPSTPSVSPSPQPAAPTKTDPKAEYNKQLGRIPGPYDPDSFENVDQPMNSQNPNLAKAREIKQGIVAGNNAKPTAPNSGGAVTAQMPTDPQGSSGGGISVGGLTLPPKTSAPNSGGAVTAQMPTDPQGSSASNIDVKIPADLGGGGTAPNSEKTPLEVGGGISIGNPDAAQEAPAKTTGAGSNKKQSSSNNGSIVDYLAGKNQAFDKASRAKLAADNGIENYTGTAQQNTDLLNKLRANEKMPQGTNATGEKQYAAGTVPKALANEPQQQQPQQQQGMGGIVGGASKLAGGAGNLAKKALIGDQPLGGIVGGVSKLAGGAGNLLKKALVGGGQQQPAAQQAAPVQQQATATTQPAAPVQQTVSTKKQTAPVQKTASNYKKTPGDASAFFKDQADEEIQENKNIAKFVKCLSEKNYSQAHEHLKKVVNSKVEKNLYRAINKI